MSDLIVFTFKTETGASEMRRVLVEMQKEHLITLEDAAVVVRKHDGKVKIKQAVSLVGAGALGGSFWGLMIGLLFWAPWLGLAIGAVAGAIAGGLTDMGVDDKFIRDVGQSIEPGNSALFLLTSETTEDTAMERLRRFNAEIYQTSLSKDAEAKLREIFSVGDEE